jgi:hypothetical protein
MVEMLEDKRFVVAWIDPYRDRRSIYKFGSEISGANGKLGCGTASLTFEAEEPAFYIGSSTILPLQYVKKATTEQRDHYFIALKRLDEAKADLKIAEMNIANYGESISWEWLLENGKPREPNDKGEVYVPIPYHHKHALANLRKGSRVAIAIVSSRYCDIADKIGRIEKKGSKEVLVRFGKTLWRIPYPDLKPANESTKEERESQRESGNAQESSQRSE